MKGGIQNLQGRFKVSPGSRRLQVSRPEFQLDQEEHQEEKMETVTTTLVMVVEMDQLKPEKELLSPNKHPRRPRPS